VDPRVPLGHGLHHLDDVDELVGLLVHARQVDLAGDRHDRSVIEIGVGVEDRRNLRKAADRPRIRFLKRRRQFYRDRRPETYGDMVEI